jgi:uncharacterized membrane protein
MWGDPAKRTVKGGTGIIFSVPPFKLFRPLDFTSFFGIFGLLRFSYPIRLLFFLWLLELYHIINGALTDTSSFLFLLVVPCFLFR